MEYYETLVGDGESTTFYFTFPFFGVNDIHVKIDGIEQSTDTYTMTPNPTPNDADTEYTGGSIEFTTAPANGATITIYREIDLVRHIDYQPTEKPLSHQLNQDFNQCIGALRELKINLKNALDLATIPTLADLLANLETITGELDTFLTADDLTDLNNTVDGHTTSINTLNGYDYVVESQSPTADNNYTWYRKYKSGFVEIGGKVSIPQKDNSSWATKTVSLPVNMGAIFDVFAGPGIPLNVAYACGVRATSNSTTLTINYINTSASTEYWFITGTIAE